MTKLLLAALLGVFLLSSIANAADKIAPIRIEPKQDRNIASEEDDFIPMMTPQKPATKFKKTVAQKRKPAAKCAGSKCPKTKTEKSKAPKT